jgi:hypothetical protein
MRQKRCSQATPFAIISAGNLIRFAAVQFFLTRIVTEKGEFLRGVRARGNNYPTL